MSKLIVAVLMLALPACGGGGGSPTTPSTPVPTPTPLPILAFVPGAGLQGHSLSIQVADRGQAAGTIWLAVYATDLTRAYKVRGTVRWDPAVLQFDGWNHGAWFEQGGALVDWSFYDFQGYFVMFLDRPTTLAPAEGTGEIFQFRLKPVAGMRSGASPIQWSDPRIYDANYRDARLDTVIGGTVNVHP